MKPRIIINATLSLLLLVTGCGKHTEERQAEEQDQLAKERLAKLVEAQKAQPKPTPEVKQFADKQLQDTQPKPKTEVEQLADTLLAQHLTSCGESWIGTRHYQFTDGTTNFVILEARGAYFSFDPSMLTDADRLNGIEWKGWIGVHGKAIRFYLSADCNLNVNGGKKGWTEWQLVGSMINWELEKKEGKWQISNPTYLVDLDPGTPIEPISCDQKPQ